MILIAAASFTAWALVAIMWLTTRTMLADIRQQSAIPRVNAELEKLHISLSTIKTITTILPLLGLLGTVFGMLETFATIQHHGTGRPELFACGIRQALLTTQAGLCTALPLLFSHHILRSRLRTITSRIQLIMHVTKSSDKSSPKPESQ
ncbi:MAG: MotA/TolQ/ExbB proton channel family protein [Phycisphaerae bacterium]|nr:MotA/TolQ/ExbB proton channel family protein [Phycisphaerae bacterium]